MKSFVSTEILVLFAFLADVIPSVLLSAYSCIVLCH